MLLREASGDDPLSAANGSSSASPASAAAALGDTAWMHGLDTPEGSAAALIDALGPEDAATARRLLTELGARRVPPRAPEQTTPRS